MATAIVEEEENSSLKSNYSACPIYKASQVTTLFAGVKLAECTPVMEQNMYCLQKTVPVESFPIAVNLTVSNKMTCSICCTAFKDRLDQRQHYKLDWHRFNLKRKLCGQSHYTEPEFNTIAEEISSLSGSDTDTDESECDLNDSFGSPRSRAHFFFSPKQQKRIHKDSISTDTEGDDTDDGGLKGTSRLEPKIYLQNSDEQIIALYRCVVHGKKNIPESETDLIQLVFDVLEQLKWAVILVGGGHFASAIFDRGKICAHKTFHRYTVRAKQGTTQNIRDGRWNHKPKSAGASLRRSNELALIKEIQDLLKSWSKELQECHRIFYRAPSFNRISLFASKNPPFRKDDNRLRTIPFPTRRATFKEVQRVYELLIKIECFDNRHEMKEAIPKSPKVHLGSKPKKSSRFVEKEKDGFSQKGNSEINKCAERDLFKDTPEVYETRTQSAKRNKTVLESISKYQEDPVGEENVQQLDNCSNESCEIEYEITKEEISFKHLKEFEVHVPKKHKRRSNKKNPKRQQDPDDHNAKEKYQMKSALYVACKSGDIQSLVFLLMKLKNPHETPVTILHSQQTNNTEQHIFKTDSSSTDLARTKNVSVLDKEDFVKRDLKKFSKEVVSDSSLKTDNINSLHSTFTVNAKSKSDINQKMDLDLSTLSLQSTASISSSLLVNKNLIGVTKSDHFHRRARRHSIAVAISEISSQHTMLETCTKIKQPHSTPSSPQTKSKKQQTQTAAVSPIPLTLDVINEPINDNGTTLLHLAAKEGHQEIVSLLLVYGANPTIQEKLGKTPYMLSKNKEVRKSFQHFMADNPEMYDYSKAQIPSPLTDEMERKQTERRKERKKAKKKNTQKIASEQSAEQISTSSCFPVSIHCCVQCDLDLSGQVPFEYNGNHFCSTQCVKEHRKKFR